MPRDTSIIPRCRVRVWRLRNSNFKAAFCPGLKLQDALAPDGSLHTESDAVFNPDVETEPGVETWCEM